MRKPHSMDFMTTSDQVIDLRTVAGLRFLYSVFARGQEFRQRSVGIPKVTKHPHFGGTGLYARGNFPAFNAMSAERALLHHAAVLAEEARFVRAGDDAITAADAVGFIDDHDSIVPLVRSARRTDA